MSKVTIIRLYKSLKSRAKCFLGEGVVPYVCWCRRINRVKTAKRLCAMTFDDGPTRVANAEPLTSKLIEALEKYGACGTFDIIGTTKNNYPDTEGEIGTPAWSGVSYDHYPSFGKDDDAGALACPELVERILAGGHEITNHTWSHILFGKKSIIYSKRHHLSSFEKALDDVKKLHDHLKELYGYEISMSRPPHYVDRISKKLTSYDLYAYLGYQYLGASFDGAGWLPLSGYDEEVNAMVDPLKKALKNNPDELCGQIIFQKDGLNMALRAPVVDGLEKQLAVLQEHEYKVIGVSALLSEFPFTDVGDDDPDFALFKRLLSDHAILYTDNTLRPDKPMTMGELAVFLAPKEATVDRRIEAILQGKKKVNKIPVGHVYSGAWLWMKENGYPAYAGFHPSKKLTLAHFSELGKFFDISKLENVPLTRRNIWKAYKI